MSRRTDNLERLCNKLERRFGKSDSLFLQAKTELDTCIANRPLQSVRHDWAMPYSAFIGRLDKKTTLNPVTENL
jgi:uncharacterized protein (DUF1697 family)